MKRSIFQLIVLGIIVFNIPLMGSCRKDLDTEVKPNYAYHVEKNLLANAIQKGETISFTYAIKCNQAYQGAAFTFQYFQKAGSGKLFSDSSTVYEVNRSYPIPADGKIKFNYTSQCEVLQVLEFVFTDKFGKCVSDTVKLEVKALPDRSFKVELLPVKEAIWTGESVPLDFKIVCNNPYEGAAYKFRYFQSTGTGKLSLPDNAVINGNQNYSIGSDGRLQCSYVSSSHNTQKLNFVFEDELGHKVECPVTFKDRAYPYFSIDQQGKDTLALAFHYKDLHFSLNGIDAYLNKSFKYSYSLLKGSGKMYDLQDNLLSPNQKYPIASTQQFFLKYYPQSYGQHILDMVVEDVFANPIHYYLNLTTTN